MTKKQAKNSIVAAKEDLNELRELVQSTYEELQLTLQQQKSSSDNNQSNNKEIDITVKTSLAAFNLAIGAALQRISKIAENPSSIIKSEVVIAALGKLTWYLLRIAPFLGNPNQNLLVCQSTGAALERLNFNERLCTKEHCGFLFTNFQNYVVYRQKQQANIQSTGTERIDAILQSFCPALMTYFCKNLGLFKELREEAKDIIGSLERWSRPITMIRRFVLQAIDETILLAFVEKDSDESITKITYAQRVNVDGLYVIKDLAEWAITSEESKFVEVGNSIEMSSWTGLRDNEEGIMCKGEEKLMKTHRIYQEGIPNDIPTLEGEKIIIFYSGKMKRVMNANKVFPMVVTKISKEGTSFSDAELTELQKKIQDASSEDVQTALEHQIGRGSNDDLIRQTMIRLKMSSLVTIDDL